MTTSIRHAKNTVFLDFVLNGSRIIEHEDTRFHLVAFYFKEFNNQDKTCFALPCILPLEGMSETSLPFSYFDYHNPENSSFPEQLAISIEKVKQLTISIFFCTSSAWLAFNTLGQKRDAKEFIDMLREEGCCHKWIVARLPESGLQAGSSYTLMIQAEGLRISAQILPKR